MFLLTDDLAKLATRLKDSGLTAVRGKFYVYDGALPNLDEIDESQLDQSGYNPAISGLNLNFNRVHFEWQREGGAYTVMLDARSINFRPAVTVAKMRIVDRSVPVYTYRDGGGLDEWTVHVVRWAVAGHVGCPSDTLRFMLAKFLPASHVGTT